MIEKTDNPHDTRMTELFNNKEAFISFIKDCVKADWAERRVCGEARKATCCRTSRGNRQTLYMKAS